MMTYWHCDPNNPLFLKNKSTLLTNFEAYNSIIADRPVMFLSILHNREAGAVSRTIQHVSLLSPDNHASTLLCCEFDYFGFLM